MYFAAPRAPVQRRRTRDRAGHSFRGQLHQNLDAYILSYLEKPPIPSASGAISLARRDKDLVVDLGKTRDRAGGRSSTRLPLDNRDLPGRPAPCSKTLPG